MEKKSLKKIENNTEVETPAESKAYVSMEDLILMKVYKMQNLTYRAISEKMEKEHKILISERRVSRCLKLFEQILPEADDMKEKIINRLEEVKEQILHNAEKICFAADLQVMRKIFDPETTAVDAAKVRQIYGGQLASVLGIKNGLPEDERSSPRVVNFIQNFIISNNKNDRIDTANERRIDGHEHGGAPSVFEGIMP